MCGLFGWISYRCRLEAADLAGARAATALLVHRGPDHQGEWFDGHTYMGHRRLSIIYGKRGILDLTHSRLFTFGTFTRLFEQVGLRSAGDARCPSPVSLGGRGRRGGSRVAGTEQRDDSNQSLVVLVSDSGGGTSTTGARVSAGSSAPPFHDALGCAGGS